MGLVSFAHWLDPYVSNSEFRPIWALRQIWAHASSNIFPYLCTKGEFFCYNTWYDKQFCETICYWQLFLQSDINNCQSNELAKIKDLVTFNVVFEFCFILRIVLTLSQSNNNVLKFYTSLTVTVSSFGYLHNYSYYEEMKRWRHTFYPLPHHLVLLFRVTHPVTISCPELIYRQPPDYRTKTISCMLLTKSGSNEPTVLQKAASNLFQKKQVFLSYHLVCLGGSGWVRHAQIY